MRKPPANAAPFAAAEAAHHQLVAAIRGPNALPAGGAAGVTAIAMGMALGIKVLRLSPDASSEVTAAGPLLDELLSQLLPEFALDCTAFTALLAALRLPRDAERKTALDAAWHEATAAPVRVARIAGRAADLLSRCTGDVKASLAGDLAAAQELVGAGCRIAVANARENAQHLAPEVATELLRPIP